MTLAMLQQLEKDWVKLATAATQDQMDVEKAFLDQAYTFLQNKAGPIMKAPYRVGFEIVHKNDDNTRMAGIFVFRVGKELFYAPAFFINGSIKGTDLFYRCEQKRFVPLTAGWVSQLMNNVPKEEGAGLPVRDRNQHQMKVNFNQLAFPPGHGSNGSSFKFASAEEIATPVELKLLAEHVKSAMTANLLEKFVKESAGVSATGRLAATAEKSFPFADALYRSCPWLDNLELTVKAAAAPQDLVVLHLNPVMNKRASTATDVDRKLGYCIEDNRKDANVNLEVFNADPNTMGSFEHPGVYEVPQSDGQMLELFLAYHDDEHKLQRQPWYGDVQACNPEYSLEQLVAVDPKTGRSGRVHLRSNEVLYAKAKGSIRDHAEAVSSPKADTAYRLYNHDDGTLSEPFFVKRLDTADQTLTRAICCWSDKLTPGDEFTLTLNPDYAGFKAGVNIVGSCCRFVPQALHPKRESVAGRPVTDPSWISYDTALQVETSAALENFVRKQAGLLKMSVRWDSSNEQFLLQREDEAQPVKRSSWIGAETYLMVKCALRQTDAAQLLLKAMPQSDAPAQASVFYHQPMEKLATNLRPAPMPEFDEEIDDSFGMIMEPHSQTIMAEAMRDGSTMPEARIDDLYRGEGNYQPDNVPSMDTLNPMQLFQLSQEQNIPHMFDHGVVGSLLQTYDSMALVDRYVPDLETALDCLGRLLFLFYWKPEDFSQAYGSDDMTALENKLLSNFRSFGALVLELIQKTNPTATGTASLN